MWTRLILGLGVYEAFIIGLLQSDINEVAKVDSIVSELIDRLEKK